MVPLLDMSGLYTERKFSGSTTAGHSVDVVGSAIDAYAHHVLVDSDGTLLLTDLQCMFSQYSATWGLIIVRCHRTRPVHDSVQSSGAVVRQLFS